MTYLLDTNVVSERRRPRPDPHVRALLDTLDPRGLFISVVVIGEIAKGAARVDDNVKRVALFDWLASVEADFAGRILPVDGAVARRWGETTGRLAARGRTLPPADGLIAATAFVHDLTLPTRNLADFADTDVRVLDPWTTSLG